ncbi:MAG TPA: glycosyltransferase family 4 protein [Asanoa sp.]
MSRSPSTIVYVALGAYRVRAAREYAANLAASGVQVHLVVADLPAWQNPELPAKVTVHRTGSAEPRRAIRDARRFITGRDGPLSATDLLVAGDPLAIPVAFAAAQRRPDLPLRLEPTDEPNRVMAPADLAVVTPWYPSPNNPFAGAFVEAAVAAVRGNGRRVAILHTEDWTPAPNPLSHLTAITADRLVSRALRGIVTDTPLGELTRVPVLIEPQRDYAAWAYAHVNALRAALPAGEIEAPLIHAHTGIYGGVLAANLARTDARVVVTEHSTFLPRIFAQPDARWLYEDMLERVDALLCVSEYLREQIGAQFPRYADKLQVVPNVVDFDRFARREEPPADLLRWLYLGRLVDQKRVGVLLEGFALAAKEDPRLRLTMVGDGPLAGELQGRAAALGLADRVEIRPAVLPEDVVKVMHEHDLLVHASAIETFGMTVVEAVASGMPVLVARSPGPAETLADLEHAAGMLVDVSDDPRVIADGYRDLRARAAALDLPAARYAFLARYGRVAVARMLREAYVAHGPATPHAATTATAAGDIAGPADAHDRVLLIAINPYNYRRTVAFAQHLVDVGYGVDLITTEERIWRRLNLDDRVRVFEVGENEEKLVGKRVPRLLLDALPGKALEGLRGVTRQRRAVWPELTIARAQQLQSRGSEAVRAKVFDRGYRLVRPIALWRIVRREVLPRLDLDRLRGIVVAGASGVTTAARIGRAYPDVTVTTSINASEWPATTAS